MGPWRASLRTRGRTTARLASESREIGLVQSWRPQWQPERRGKGLRTSRGTFGRRRENARLSTEAEEIHGIGKRADSRLASPHVVARCQIDGLHSARKSPCLEQQLGVRSPSAARNDRFVTESLEQLTEHRNAVEPKGRERIGVRFWESPRAVSSRQSDAASAQAPAPRSSPVWRQRCRPLPQIV